MDKMTLQQRQKQCLNENALNAKIERQLQKASKTLNCAPTEEGKYSKCCSIPPVAPITLVPNCICKPAKPTFNRFCTRVQNECGRVELTPYAKEFARNTGKMVQNCQCVKFNGLQDSCQHRECKTKVNCVDNPFPNCPPAQLWKKDYNRNHSKTDKC